MRFLGVVVAVAMAVSLAGCGVSKGGGPSAVSRQLDAGPELAVDVPLAVEDVRVSVPRSLKVSEAEIYYPIADIVWRGDPRGNRYEQIEAIYGEAARAAIDPLTTGLPVVAEIEVTRFHSVTDKARYTLGGVHSLRFDLTIRLAATGEILSGPRRVNADARAAGGQKALDDEYAGISQKRIVTDHLALVIRRELSSLKVDPALAAVVAVGPAG